MEQILVQRALNELQTIESRLYNKLDDFQVVGTRKATETKVSETRESVEKFAINAKAKLQSVTDLVVRYNTLKHAIMTSNANTKVIIGGKEYTVMTAIERKRSINYEKAIVRQLKSVLLSAERKVDRENAQVEREIEKRVVQMCNGDLAARKADFVTEFEKNYRANNEWVLVDSLQAKELIEQLEQEILAFELEVDTALTVANSTTVIAIP